MSFDFRNTNTLWSSIIADTLFHLGLTTVVICPGSRSTPLTIAFTQHPHLTTIPILDERSASFFALGLAKRQQKPVLLICTSGTAGANFYPAIIEAKYSYLPLLIITADRPPELRECHAGQTINQTQFYNTYPNWQIELPVPQGDINLLRHLRQTLIHAWEKCTYPVNGVVHLNQPFQDPLPPLPQPHIAPLKSHLDPERFFTHLQPLPDLFVLPSHLPSKFLNLLNHSEQGIIIAGLSQPKKPQQYSQSVAHLAQYFNAVILSDALSPLRNYSQLNPHLITTYDFILRNPQLADNLKPKWVIQLGELPTSKELRNWLTQVNPQRWIIDPNPDNFDPLDGTVTHIRTTVESLVQILPSIETIALSYYLKNWLNLEQKFVSKREKNLENCQELYEGKIAWLLSKYLPPKTAIMVANSMPIRYMEWFWTSQNKQHQIFFSRGTNGIDGTLSTALGIAYNHNQTILLTGDLAFLHDTNGLLIRPKFKGHLTIILVNNNGGGIFEHLPISQFDPPFEDYFATPQEVNFQCLCQTYGIQYHHVTDWTTFIDLISHLPEEKIRVLEIPTHRKKDVQYFRDSFL